MSSPNENTQEKAGDASELAPAKGPAATPPNVLLVSDDLMFPSRVREGLRPLGYPLTVAGSGDAVDKAITANPPPSVILVNLNARRYDPLDLIARLKDSDTTRKIPLLAFAGHVEKEKHDAARGAGADLIAANSSVSQHLPALLERLLSGSASGQDLDHRDDPDDGNDDPALDGSEDEAESAA